MSSRPTIYTPTMRIAYIELNNYKYRLQQATQYYTNIKPHREIRTKFFSLVTNGLLTVKAGYCWDGLSGPAMDDVKSLRASLFHDVFCQMIGEGHLPASPFRAKADLLFKEVMLIDGVGKFVAEYRYFFIRKFGPVFGALVPHKKKEILFSPPKEPDK